MKEKIFSAGTAKTVFFILLVFACGLRYGISYTGMKEKENFFKAVLEANFNFFSKDNLKNYSTLINFVGETMWFLVFELLYGNRVAGRFGIASAYYFTRQASRNRWFLVEAGKLAGITVVYVLAYYAGRLGMGFRKNSYYITMESIVAILVLVLYISLYLYMFTLLVNILAVLWDGTPAFLITSSLQFLAIGALTIIGNRQLRNWRGGLLVKVNPVSNIIISWHSSNYWKHYMNEFHLHFPVWYSFIYFTVLIGVLLAAGCAAIRYRVKKL